MLPSDVIENVRIQAVEPNPAQRWSDEALLPLVGRAQAWLVRKMLYPPSRYVFNTQPNVMFYQIDEILETKQVYVQGQPLPRTDIDTLEGNDFLFYDQTGQGGGPGGFIFPGQPPALAGGIFSPRWSSATGTYPVASSLGIAASVKQPWIAGMRPEYFFDGGVFALVPAPLGIYPVVIHCVRQPALLQSTEDPLVVPLSYLEAMTWKVIELVMFSNADQPGASDQRNYAQSQVESEIRDLRKVKRTYDGKKTKGPNMLTYRSFFARGRR